ncbi:unnamed protein product, partial [Effrenium voratum]
MLDSPSFLVVVKSKGSGKAEQTFPVSLHVNRCTAHPFEALRLRCLDPKCELRPESERGGNGDDPNCELNAADLEADDVELDIAEAADEDCAMTDDMDPGVSGAASHKRNIWVFKRPMSRYTSIFRELCAEGAGCTVILTRTAHPGSVVAARKLVGKVFYICTGPNDHQKAHGRATMEQMFAALRWKQAETAVGGGPRKRLAARDVNLIEVSHLGSTTVMPRDISAPESSQWRGGLDFHIPDLASKSAKQVEAELERWGLQIVSTPEGRALRAGKAFSEGDLVCYAAGPSYSSLEMLLKFFAQPENIAFLDRICVAEFKDGPVYRVLTGCSGFLQHYVGIRKGGANCVVVANTSAGISDELFEVRISTR